MKLEQLNQSPKISQWANQEFPTKEEFFDEQKEHEAEILKLVFFRHFTV